MKPLLLALMAATIGLSAPANVTAASAASVSEPALIQVADNRHRDGDYRLRKKNPSRYWRDDRSRARLGIFLGYGTVYRPYVVQPTPIVRYRTTKVIRLSARHVNWCEHRYRSYRVSDNSFQPYQGGRKACVSPYWP